jgi:DNA-damage-inducible protein J
LGYNVAQEFNMPANAVVRARIDEKTKKQAEKVFKRMGLTTSSAFRMFLIRTVAEKRLPFDPQPNKETIEAVRELKKGGGKRFATVADLMADLNADD